MVVGAPYSDIGSNDAGVAYIYDLTSPSPTTAILRLDNPEPAVNDNFSYAVAMFGSMIVVGAQQDDAGAQNSGSVYIYDLNSATPSNPVLTLPNPFPQQSAFFGSSVAISGSYIVVGAWQENNNTGGAAFVFDLNSPTPSSPIAALNNPAPGLSNWFGFSVGIFANMVVVGAPRNDAGAVNAGAAYVYELNSPVPTSPMVVLNNPSPANEDLFGRAVAISENLIVVGSPYDDSSTVDSGLAFVFDLNSPTPTIPLYTLNNPTPAANDRFGRSVAISKNHVAISAWDDDTGATDAGSVYVYNLNAPMSPPVTLNNPTPSLSDAFGYSVAVSETYIGVGAVRDDTQSVDQGAAYVYTVAAPAIASVQINDNAVQRSRVTNLTIVFNQVVTLASGIPTNAFMVTGPTGPIAFTVDLSFSTPTQSIAKFTFTGPGTEFGSLSDGNYTLTILANQVVDAYGQSLDDNNDGVPGGNYIFTFHRLFGDADGNGTVSAADFNAFRLAYGTGPSIFDFNNDGQTNAADFNQFRTRYGVMLLP